MIIDLLVKRLKGEGWDYTLMAEFMAGCPAKITKVVWETVGSADSGSIKSKRLALFGACFILASYAGEIDEEIKRTVGGAPTGASDRLEYIEARKAEMKELVTELHLELSNDKAEGEGPAPARQ